MKCGKFYENRIFYKFYNYINSLYFSISRLSFYAVNNFIVSDTESLTIDIFDKR